MPSYATASFRLELAPSVAPGCDNQIKLAIPGSHNLTGETNTGAQVLCTVDDYAGGGTDPEVDFPIENGYSLSPGVVTGFTSIEVIAQELNGEPNDWDFVLSLAARAFPTIAGDPSLFRGRLILGNPAAADENRVSIPLTFDSTLTGRAIEAGSVLSFPAGLTTSASYPLTLTVFESLNASVAFLIQGK